MEKIDWIGVAGLTVGLAALLVAIWGIRDVRKLVRELIAIERNRTWTRVLHKNIHLFVDLTNESAPHHAGAADKHEFSLLARYLQPDLSMEDVLGYANCEALILARDMVRHGHATWKDDFDETKVAEVIQDWQGKKNTAALKKIFGESPSLFQGDADKMVEG